MDVTTLLAAIKRRAYLPDAGTEETTNELLAIADAATVEVCLPMMLATRSGFLQQTTTYLLTSGASSFSVPPRAVGGAVTMVRFRDTSQLLYNIAQIDESQRVWQAQLPSAVSWYSTWYFSGGSINLQPVPQVGQTGELLVTYTARPNRLVSGATIQQIFAVNPATGTVTLTIDPTGFFAPGDHVDIVKGDGVHDWAVFDGIVTAINAAFKTVTISGYLPTSSVAPGDFLSQAGQTRIPQMPDEMHELLACEAAREVLDEIGDPRTAALAERLAIIRQQIGMFLDPRAAAQPKRVINRFSAMRMMRRRQWGGIWR